MLLNKLKTKGFTLLEGIIAILLITVGVNGVYILISQVISSSVISSQKLIAAYLAQEGIEIIRNIRDTNWLRGSSWDNGLVVGDWEVDYKSTSTQQAYVGNYLNIDNNGFYSYSSGTTTPFKRKITISQPASYIINVVVLVEWLERGKSHSIKAQESLYNWQ